MAQSAIEWTEQTWNPTTGCNKVSPGCKYCYAETMAHRLQAMGIEKYRDAFAFRLHPEALLLPMKWKPSVIFVNSMSDLFHVEMPTDYLLEVFAVMNHCPQHQFQVLTKRSDRLRELSPLLPWTPNIWMGVSVEKQDYAYRIDDLRASHAHLKFLSLEPLLGPLSALNLEGIDWVIVGGESGPKARPMEADWVRSIRDQCKDQQVPFFFKQWGGSNKKKAGRMLDGCIHDEMPNYTIPQPVSLF
jgi:protein gp37